MKSFRPTLEFQPIKMQINNNKILIKLLKTNEILTGNKFIKSIYQIPKLTILLVLEQKHETKIDSQENTKLMTQATGRIKIHHASNIQPFL